MSSAACRKGGERDASEKWVTDGSSAAAATASFNSDTNCSWLRDCENCFFAVKDAARVVGKRRGREREQKRTREALRARFQLFGRGELRDTL